MQVAIKRLVTIPNQLKLARLGRAAEIGPRPLFFSGGSALAATSQAVARYTHNAIHLITTFDSGGSSARLRQAFGMPAVGDLRNRLMSLADRSIQGHPEIVALFSYRFPARGVAGQLEERLAAMAAGHDPLVAAIPDPMRKLIRNHLGYFMEAMPPGFELAGASIGNLVLSGGYLNNNRHLDPVVYLFSKLAEVRATVRPILNQNLHLAARLADGRVVVGQHLITGREVPPLATPIEQVFLTASRTNPQPFAARIREKTAQLIAQAELICYPMGSFFSSLAANLLPLGVAQAIAANPCPKVFVPNMGLDKELPRASAAQAAQRLLGVLEAGLEGGGPGRSLLDFVVVDSAGGSYPGGLDLARIRGLGLGVIDTPLVTSASAPLIDGEKLANVLLSLA